MNCIYCKIEITPEIESVEHVFPAAFGCPDTWALDSVCRPCNNKFGRTIENWLANDSLEATFRLRTIGSRSGDKVRSKRFRVRIPLEEKYAGFQGAIMEKDYETQGQFKLPAQAGFKDEKGEYVFFSKEDLTYLPNLEKAKSLSQKQIKVLAPDAEHDNMMEFLAENGIKVIPDESGKFHLDESSLEADGKMVLDIAAVIDHDIQRAVAKISLNYLAKIKGAEYVLQQKFDEIRDFINGGEYKQLVVPFHEPILLDDSDNQRHLIHIFIFERNSSELHGVVSLFNQGMAYKVLLSSEMGPLWYPMVSGHMCEPRSKSIHPLGHFTGSLL
jgi:hypothetical protein